MDKMTAQKIIDKAIVLINYHVPISKEIINLNTSLNAIPTQLLAEQKAEIERIALAVYPYRGNFDKATVSRIEKIIENHANTIYDKVKFAKP